MLKVQNTNGVTSAEFLPNSKLNIANASELKGEFLDLLKHGNAKIELNLANLEYIDSSGVGVLLSLLRACREKSCSLTLMKPQQAVRDLFNLLQLQSIFNII